METEAQPPSSQPAVGGRATATTPYHDADCTLRALAARAEGFGRHAIGGLHGPLYYVTSLQDDGCETLREACCIKEPLWIIFEVSGTIHLHSYLRVSSYKTIDGRGQRVKLTGYGLQLKDCHHVTVCNLEFEINVEMRNLHRKARDNAVRIFQDNENLKLELENKRRELNSRAKQLEKLTAENAIDRKKLDDEKRKVKPHCSFLHFLGELLLQDVFLIMAVASFQHTTTVEGIYSTELERCKLPEIIAVCKKYKVVVVTVAFSVMPLLLARARICISASHSMEDLIKGLEAISKVGDLVGIKYFPVEQEKTTSVEKLKKLQ